LNYHQDHFNF